MKIILGVLLSLTLVGCGQDSFQYENAKQCTVEQIPTGAVITCPDGTQSFITNGSDGQDGQDGQDAVILTRVMAPANACTLVYPGVWVENINTGKVFDVYYNANCSDAQGEYCDNVVPVDESTGSVGQYNGSGTVCWADNLQLSGVLRSGGDIEVYILDFN